MHLKTRYFDWIMYSYCTILNVYFDCKCQLFSESATNRLVDTRLYIVFSENTSIVDNLIYYIAFNPLASFSTYLKVLVRVCHVSEMYF